MRIKLKLIEPWSLSMAPERAELDIELGEHATLEDALDGCLERFGSKLIGGSPEYQKRYLRDSVLILINDKPVSTAPILQAVLHDGDRVVLIPPISGGQHSLRRS